PAPPAVDREGRRPRQRRVRPHEPLAAEARALLDRPGALPALRSWRPGRRPRRPYSRHQGLLFVNRPHATPFRAPRNGMERHVAALRRGGIAAIPVGSDEVMTMMGMRGGAVAAASALWLSMAIA